MTYRTTDMWHPQDQRRYDFSSMTQGHAVAMQVNVFESRAASMRQEAKWIWRSVTCASRLVTTWRRGPSR